MWRLNFPSCLDKNLILKVYIGVEVTLHTSLNSGLDEIECLASRLVCLTFVIYWLVVWWSPEPASKFCLQRTALLTFLSFTSLSIHCAVPTLHSGLFHSFVYSPVLVCFIVSSSGTRFLSHSLWSLHWSLPNEMRTEAKCQAFYIARKLKLWRCVFSFAFSAERSFPANSIGVSKFEWLSWLNVNGEKYANDLLAAGGPLHEVLLYMSLVAAEVEWSNLKKSFCLEGRERGSSWS